MKLIDDRSADQWLEGFVPSPENFDWDDGNKGKNKKHGISENEIESIFSEFEYGFVGRILEPVHDEWRGLILGYGEKGKGWALVFTRRGEKLRVISCRPMRKEEKELYEKES